MKKFGKLLLAGAIALGGISVLDATIPSEQHQYQHQHRVYADVLNYSTWAYSYSPNTIDHSFTFNVVNSINHSGRLANYYIKNSNGTILQSGRSKFLEGFIQGGYVSYTTETVHSDVTSLAPGTYELLYIYTVGSTSYRFSVHFTKASNGTITVSN